MNYRAFQPEFELTVIMTYRVWVPFGCAWCAGARPTDPVPLIAAVTWRAETGWLAMSILRHTYKGVRSLAGDESGDKVTVTCWRCRHSRGVWKAETLGDYVIFGRDRFL